MLIEQPEGQTRALTIKTHGAQTYGSIVIELVDPATENGHKVATFSAHRENRHGDTHNHVTFYTHEADGKPRHAFGYQFGKPAETTWLDFTGRMAFMPYSNSAGGFAWIDPENRGDDDPVYEIDIPKAIEAGILKETGITVGELRAPGVVPARKGVKFGEEQ